VFSVPDLKRISFEEAIQQEFRPTRLGEWFGPSWVCMGSINIDAQSHFWGRYIHEHHGFS
jgi:hypothetical protein